MTLLWNPGFDAAIPLMLQHDQQLVAQVVLGRSAFANTQVDALGISRRQLEFSRAPPPPASATTSAAAMAAPAATGPSQPLYGGGFGSWSARNVGAADAIVMRRCTSALAVTCGGGAGGVAWHDIILPADDGISSSSNGGAALSFCVLPGSASSIHTGGVRAPTAVPLCATDAVMVLPALLVQQEAADAIAALTRAAASAKDAKQRAGTTFSFFDGLAHFLGRVLTWRHSNALLARGGFWLFLDGPSSPPPPQLLPPSITQAQSPAAVGSSKRNSSAVELSTVVAGVGSASAGTAVVMAGSGHVSGRNSVCCSFEFLGVATPAIRGSASALSVPLRQSSRVSVAAPKHADRAPSVVCSQHRASATLAPVLQIFRTAELLGGAGSSAASTQLAAASVFASVARGGPSTAAATTSGGIVRRRERSGDDDVVVGARASGAPAGLALRASTNTNCTASTSSSSSGRNTKDSVGGGACVITIDGGGRGSASPVNAAAAAIGRLGSSQRSDGDGASKLIGGVVPRGSTAQPRSILKPKKWGTALGAAGNNSNSIIVGGGGGGENAGPSGSSGNVLLGGEVDDDEDEEATDLFSGARATAGRVGQVHHGKHDSQLREGDRPLFNSSLPNFNGASVLAGVGSSVAAAAAAAAGGGGIKDSTSSTQFVMNTQGEQLFGFNESQGFGHFGALHELELQQQRDQIVVNNSTIRGHPVAVTTGVSAASSRGGTNVCNSPNMSGATPTGRNTTTATGSSSRRKSGGKLSVLSDSQGALDGGAGWMFGEDDKHGSAHGAHGTAALMAKEQSSQVVAFDHYATKNRSSDVGVGGEFGDAASKTATAGGNRGSKAKTPKSSN